LARPSTAGARGTSGAMSPTGRMPAPDACQPRRRERSHLWASLHLCERGHRRCFQDVPIHVPQSDACLSASLTLCARHRCHGIHFAPSRNDESMWPIRSHGAHPMSRPAEVLAVSRALGDPSRLRILAALTHGELCACQIVELLGLANSTTSKHLSILHQAGLLDSRKEGRWVHYQLARQPSPVAEAALRWTLGAMAGTPEVLEDEARLQKILSLTPEALCQQQAQGVACCSSAPATHVAAKWRKAGHTA